MFLLDILFFVSIDFFVVISFASPFHSIYEIAIRKEYKVYILLLSSLCCLCLDFFFHLPCLSLMRSIRSFVFSICVRGHTSDGCTIIVMVFNWIRPKKISQLGTLIDFLPYSGTLHVSLSVVHHGEPEWFNVTERFWYISCPIRTTCCLPLLCLKLFNYTK